jgi:serine/threonine protein kinase
LNWFVQMALGLHYMHGRVQVCCCGWHLIRKSRLRSCFVFLPSEERVLHRDLKTQNIFLLGNGTTILNDQRTTIVH